MNGARLGVGGQSVGLSEAAYREAVKYANERTQFGKAIIQFPAVYEMLTDMRVKLQASRSLLYETSRFVDIYKVYMHLSNDRKLEKDERDEMKEYQRLADAYTPLLKMLTSEYSNQIAYDSLQIHGGAGFMKDFPIERIYRDARITTIYEGTSQLQVVAAIKGVTTGVYLSQMNAYSRADIAPDREHLRRTLVEMTEEYAETVARVIDVNDSEYIDFHARRLVEMAGNIILGFLLLLDSTRDDIYLNSAEICVRKGQAQNRERATFIKHFELKDIGNYKMTE